MVGPVVLLLFSGMQTLYAQKIQNGNNAVIPILKSCLGGTIQEQQLCTQQSISKHLGEKLRYPKVAKDAGKSGTVVAQINVNKEGYVSDVKILKSQGWGMDEEVVSVLSSLDQFDPVEHEGQLVNAQLTMPVKFLLEEKTPPRFLEVRNFKIAPNPNNGQFELSFNTKIPTDTIITLDPETYKESVKVVTHSTEIKIYDFNGKLVHEKRTSDGNFRQQIQLGNVPKGIYYVVIKQLDGEYVEKMIIE